MADPTFKPDWPREFFIGWTRVVKLTQSSLETLIVAISVAELYKLRQIKLIDLHIPQ